MTEPQRLKKLNCAHLFHAACIDQWLVIKAKCPNCRLKVNAELIPEAKSETVESEEPNPLFLSVLMEFANAAPEDDANARLIRARIHRLSRGMHPVEEIPSLSFRAALRNSRLGQVARRIKREMARRMCCRA